MTVMAAMTIALLGATVIILLKLYLEERDKVKWLEHQIKSRDFLQLEENRKRQSVTIKSTKAEEAADHETVYDYDL